MDRKLYVAFLWHMHQPMYKDFFTGKYYLPWVRLHSTLSYLDMASILDDFPEIRCTFNLTPSLMYQLIDIGENDVDDIYLKLSLKDASELNFEEKRFMLRHFFTLHPFVMNSTLKKYKEMSAKKDHGMTDFSTADFRDLQVYFNLAWCGFTLKRRDPLVRELFAKAENYSEDEKRQLLKRQKEVVASILPLYKRLQDEGRIEVSTTPYHHPILPLIPEEDAAWHMDKAIELYKNVFGKNPVGMWPAEGSVSQKVVPIFASKGIKWIATDESVLMQSYKGSKLGRDDLLFRPHSAGSLFKKVDMIFRDVNLSNAISFRYSNMAPDQAARDLYKDFVGIRNIEQYKKGNHVAAVILDGENPWPYYHEGGRTFLSELYRLLISDKNLETTTIGNFLAKHRDRKKIKHLASGSWINCDFRKWAGSPQKDKAWEYLKKVRQDMFASGKPDRKALEELYLAEASDYFWWYDDFGSDYDLMFDNIFRMHLSNIYRAAGKSIPAFLEEPIYKQVAKK